METTGHYLINMPDHSTKQTLCVMPKTETKPTSWEEICDGEFLIINGEHSVATSKSMLEIGIIEQIARNFRRWNCFIVWSKDKRKLQRLSAYYNRVNHFSVFKPTWATNVLAARYIWTSMDRPQPPKVGTSVQRASRRNARDILNDKKFGLVLIMLILVDFVIFSNGIHLHICRALLSFLCFYSIRPKYSVGFRGRYPIAIYSH